MAYQVISNKGSVTSPSGGTGSTTVTVPAGENWLLKSVSIYLEGGYGTKPIQFALLVNGQQYLSNGTDVSSGYGITCAPSVSPQWGGPAGNVATIGMVPPAIMVAGDTLEFETVSYSANGNWYNTTLQYIVTAVTI